MNDYIVSPRLALVLGAVALVIAVAATILVGYVLSMAVR